MLHSRRIATMSGDKFRDDFSMNFDGSNDYFWIGETVYSVHDTAYTFGCWVKKENHSSWQIITGQAGRSSHSFIVFRNDDETVYVETDTNGNGYTFTSSQKFVAGQWNHLVFVIVGDGTGLGYHDGVPMTPSQLGGNPFQDDLTLNVFSNDTGNRLPGSLSEFFVYDKALSASEVKTLYNGREAYDHKNGIATANLLKWYRFGDSAIDEADRPTAKSLVMGEKLGPELWTSNATNGDVTNWGKYGNNTVTTDSGMVKGTHVDSNNGIYIYLRGAYDLSGDLTFGKIYKLQFDGKVNTGSVDLYIGNARNPNGHNFSNTAMETFVYYFAPIDPGSGATDVTYFRINNLNSGQIVHLDNFSLKEVQENAGVGVNMDSDDIESGISS